MVPRLPAGADQRQGRRPQRRSARAPTLAAAVNAVEAELGEHRPGAAAPGGTEQLVRVMVEAASAEQAQAVAERLVDAVRIHLPL